MKNGPKTLIFPFCETLNNFGHDSNWSPVFEFKCPKNFQLLFINITGFCIDMAAALNESMIFIILSPKQQHKGVYLSTI